MNWGKLHFRQLYDQFLFIFSYSHFYFIYFILVRSTFSGACAYHAYSPCYGSTNKHIDCTYQTMQEPPTKNNPFRPHHLVHLLCFFHKPSLLFPLTPQLVHDSKLLLANVDLHKDAHLHLKIAVLQKIPFHSVSKRNMFNSWFPGTSHGQDEFNLQINTAVFPCSFLLGN